MKFVVIHEPLPGTPGHRIQFAEVNADSYNEAASKFAQSEDVEGQFLVVQGSFVRVIVKKETVYKSEQQEATFQVAEKKPDVNRVVIKDG